jgi:hypothetical protein
MKFESQILHSFTNTHSRLLLYVDMLLEEAYEARDPEPMLSCPIVAFSGNSCPIIDPEVMAPWVEYSKCGSMSRLIRLPTELKPNSEQHWLSDWYIDYKL